MTQRITRARRYSADAYASSTAPARADLRAWLTEARQITSSIPDSGWQSYREELARALGLDLDDRNLYHKAETVHALLGSLLEAASFGPAQVPNTAFDAAASLAEVLKTGEDIIRRQRIMATTEDWNKDPTIGVRTEEGALWREAVRRHIRDKQPTNAKILRELEELLDIDRHILDQKFNRVQGTRAGFIESYLNHSYRIQAFLEKYG